MTPIEMEALIQHVTDQNPDGDDLARLHDAVLISRSLTAQADALVGYFVDRARAGGTPWIAIGEVLGVTKQAAQKRFVPTAGAATPHAAANKRYEPATMTVLRNAALSAKDEGVAAFDIEHLLIALLQDPKSSLSALVGLHGLDSAGLVAQLGAIRREASAAPETSTLQGALVAVIAALGKQSTHSSSRAIATLNQAMGEALRLGYGTISPDALLLAILQQRDDLAVRQLAEVGITYEVASTFVRNRPL